MAGKQEMEFTYTFLDKLFRASLGENADFSGAMYNGDYSLSLEEAKEKNINLYWIVFTLRKVKGLLI